MPVIYFSSFPYTDLVVGGWFKQQFVKLQLHKFTTDDSFYVLDGDAFIRNPIDLRPNKMIRTYEYYSPYFDFIREALKLEKNNEFSFVSPLLRIERDVLVQLEEYSMSLNGRTIFEMLLCYEPYIRDKSRSNFSEAEIYGTFATQVLNKQYDYIDSPFKDCASYYDGVPDIAELFLTTSQDLVWYGSENAMPERFWKECYPKYFTN